VSSLSLADRSRNLVVYSLREVSIPHCFCMNSVYPVFAHEQIKNGALSSQVESFRSDQKVSVGVQLHHSAHFLHASMVLSRPKIY